MATFYKGPCGVVQLRVLVQFDDLVHTEVATLLAGPWEKRLKTPPKWPALLLDKVFVPNRHLLLLSLRFLTLHSFL